MTGARADPSLSSGAEHGSAGGGMAGQASCVHTPSPSPSVLLVLPVHSGAPPSGAYTVSVPVSLGGHFHRSNVPLCACEISLVQSLLPGINAIAPASFSFSQQLSGHMHKIRHANVCAGGSSPAELLCPRSSVQWQDSASRELHGHPHNLSSLHAAAGLTTCLPSPRLSLPWTLL